jgi:hypothetical protein
VQHDSILRASCIDPQVLLSAHARIVSQGFSPLARIGLLGYGPSRRDRHSQREQGASESRAEELAARTVNKERARSGESRTRSRRSTNDISSGRRGGLRSGKAGPRGRTRDQLYEEARKLGVDGRSRMSKAQLQRAVENEKP